MAKQVKLSAQVRSHIGRSAVKKIKQQGLVPGVVYGAKQAPQHVQLSAREIGDVLSHATGENFLVELEISDAGKSSKGLALIQEVQHHPLRGDVLHVDFHAVSADEKIHAEIPVETVGESIGVRSYGGLMEVSIHALEVECVPADLPDLITIDVSELNLNDAIHVRDLKLPPGVVARGDADLTVIRIAPPTVQEAAAATATAGPEVIKEKKPADEKK